MEIIDEPTEKEKALQDIIQEAIKKIDQESFYTGCLKTVIPSVSEGSLNCDMANLRDFSLRSK